MFILKKKIEKKEQISIDDDKKRENASIENSLMKKVKIKNEFEGEQKKIKRKRSKKLTLNVLRKGWVNIMREKHLKFTQKEKKISMVKFQMLLKKTTKILKEKN